MTGPLTTLKILDFTALLPGPFATMTLADLGADVVRIESPNRPDLVRVMPPFRGGVSVVHAQLNRNKSSLALDLKQPGAREVIYRLLSTYDIVFEAFRPGVMQRLGLDYATLQTHCPRLIYVSITGYGQTGSYKNRAGHDLNYMALSGALSSNGRVASGPAPMSLQVADLAGGAGHALTGVLAAVIHRQHTGEGQYIDLSMTEALFSLQVLTAPASLAEQTSPGLESELLNGGSCYDCYACADGQYLAVAPLEPQFFAEFMAIIERPDLLPFMTLQNPADVKWLKTELASTLCQQPRAFWLEKLAHRDCCVEPVLDFQEACRHPALSERQMVVTVPSHDRQENLLQIASPLRFSGTPVQLRHAGGPIGADNREVLSRAGWSTDEIVQLEAEKILL